MSGRRANVRHWLVEGGARRHVVVALLVALAIATPLLLLNWWSFYGTQARVHGWQQGVDVRTVAALYVDTGDPPADRARFRELAGRVLPEMFGRHTVRFPEGWHVVDAIRAERGRLDPTRTYVVSETDLGTLQSGLEGVVLTLEDENRPRFRDAAWRAVSWSFGDLIDRGGTYWWERHLYARSLPFWVPFALVFVAVWGLLSVWSRWQRGVLAHEQIAHKRELAHERAMREEQERAGRAHEYVFRAVLARIDATDATARQAIQLAEFDPLVAIRSATHDARNVASTPQVASETWSDEQLQAAREGYREAWARFQDILDKLRQQLIVHGHATLEDVIEVLADQRARRERTRHRVVLDGIDALVDGSSAVPIPAPWFDSVVDNVLNNAITALDRRRRAVRDDQPNWVGTLHIQVEVATSPARALVIRVQDSGGGFPATVLDHIYVDPIPSSRGRADRMGEGTLIVGTLTRAFGGTVAARNVARDGETWAETVIEFPLV